MSLWLYTHDKHTITHESTIYDLLQLIEVLMIATYCSFLTWVLLWNLRKNLSLKSDNSENTDIMKDIEEFKIVELEITFRTLSKKLKILFPIR